MLTNLYRRVGLSALTRRALIDSTLFLSSSQHVLRLQNDSLIAGAGIVRIGEDVVLQWDNSDYSVVVVNWRKKELLRINDVDLSEVKHNVIVDLSVEGDRWEGDVLHSKPCGWGVLYDKDNHKVYEGFRIGAVNVCYGSTFYADMESPDYEGVICEGQRCGHGTQFDRNAGKLREGEWVCDIHANKEMVLQNGNELFHNHVEELVVSDNCQCGYHQVVLDLRLMPWLRRLRVGQDCFFSVGVVKLIGMKCLESVTIGEHSFTTERGWLGNRVEHGNRFYLKNCPKLKELRIGSESFSEYSVCSIEDVDALETIEMGELMHSHLRFSFSYAMMELKSSLIHSE